MCVTAGNWSSIPGRGRDFFLEHNFQTSSGFIQSPVQLLLEALSLEMRWVGLETDHLRICLHGVLLCDSS
jgi:hypothetical protein